MSPSPNPMHQFIVARISRLMLNYLEDIKNDGYTAVSLDVIFDDNNVFQPDFLYVSPDRVDEIVKDRATGAPDMKIEILFPSNAKYDLRQKKEVYQKYGVKEYIIFDRFDLSYIFKSKG